MAVDNSSVIGMSPGIERLIKGSIMLIHRQSGN